MSYNYYYGFGEDYGVPWFNDNIYAAPKKTSTVKVEVKKEPKPSDAYMSYDDYVKSLQPIEEEMKEPPIDSLEQDYLTSKLMWMADYGYTLEDLLARLAFFAASNDMDFYKDPIGVLEEWESAEGFDGDIWESYDEYIDSIASEMDEAEINKFIAKEIADDERREAGNN